MGSGNSQALELRPEMTRFAALVLMMRCVLTAFREV